MTPSEHHDGARPYRRLRAAAILSCLLLTGCTTLTATGLLAASRLAPLTADPAAVSAAVSVPAGMGLRTGDAELLLGYAPDTPGPGPFAERFELEIVHLPGFDGADPNDAVFGARIAAADHERFRRTQARITRLRASGDDGLGTLSISISSGCFTGARPEKLPVST